MNNTVILLTAIMKGKIEVRVEIAEEQHGFRKNRRNVDTIFIISQIVKTAIK